VLFIYLTGPAALIRRRLEARQGHYMPASLLPSQLETLEPPHNAIEMSITQSVPDIVLKIQQILGGAAHEAYAGESGAKLN
jgi:gluconate kinase